MTLEQGLLDKAREAETRVTAAERALEAARADYHTVVRRMHLGGATLREIAAGLGVSHQRVQQIVDAAGGTWWQRLWKSRRTPVAGPCTFCGRPPSEVAKLIAGPNVYICDACVARAEKAVNAGADRGPVVVSKSLTARCAFCRKRRNAERPLIAQPAGNICGECLRVCRQILDDRAA